MYLFTDAMRGIIRFLNYLKQDHPAHSKYISNNIDEGYWILPEPLQMLHVIPHCMLFVKVLVSFPSFYEQ